MIQEPVSPFWTLVGASTHVVGAVAAATAAVWLLGRRKGFGDAWPAIVVGLALTATRCLIVAVLGDGGLPASLAEAARNLAWLVVTYKLFAADGRHASLGPIRPVVAVLAAVELLQAAIDLVIVHLGLGPSIAELAFDSIVLLRLLITVGALVLVHNLYAGASNQSRPVLLWPATGLAVLWTVDLNLYTIAYLSSGWPAEVAALRGLSAIVLAVLLTVGATQDRAGQRFRPSRAVTFQTFSLIVIGAYLAAMVAVARWLSYAGGDYARVMGLGFVVLASVAAILFLPSRRLRGWLRVTLAKHFFQHRYDYREEWLRFTRTIGNSGGGAPLGERVVQAIADIAECPAGLLLAPSDHGEMTLAARWHWPATDVPAVALSPASVAFFEREGFIVHMDDLRAGRDSRGEGQAVPEWLRLEPRAWALVPLIHYERLVGLVVLARPSMARQLDWEDFDLLRVVGQQLASYLAEHAGQEALAEASRFDDFHRRIAFVMHDIKNLASQLSLLARNAEKHADKPAFRDDMLLTLRNSADKLNTLLARLSRYGNGAIEKVDAVSASEVVGAVVGRFRMGHPVVLGDCLEEAVLANREALEQVLTHLIQNAIDASAANRPVSVSAVADGVHARFDVVDSGTGMAPEFVRTKLFKPFFSSKSGGFGIGAFEARELVIAMGGRLEVESREGLGSRFTIRLPLAATRELFDNRAGTPAEKAA
ncbi:XrtA/PEP-CTERM system histidine kinase PrsK [Novosphingobium sp. JCM 18896]|uniref:XrtA/PEP-CTERM system histidine kinase PrsK n=1 Tax=Novosphingobium sp. JCM 18896 TaxID=2989731 RepID=UPI0022228602|nr:XrtA/PEP-CTERM system histidine kinase PrsK [Novosphingobium sp. JCM 18896]MCW1428220.1 PEP-CTERM system histidine kinase PrsK [Novosphingobium sp. JCM 18896]